MVADNVVIDPNQPCRNRAAGHDSIRQSGSYVCKYVNPLSDTDSGNSEIRFYEKQLPHVPSIHAFVPKYRGTKTITVDDQQRTYIILDDLTYKFSRPSVIDIKMGTRLVAENATPRQINRINRKKFAGQEKIGCRISGVRIYRNDKNKYVTDPDKILRNVLPETWAQTFVDYYLFDGKKVHYQVAEQIIPQLKDIKQGMLQNTKLRLSLSSLLIIYETDENSPTNVQVKMIDFGHVVENTEPQVDQGYITGIDSIIRYLEQIIEQKMTPSTDILFNEAE